MPLFGISGVIVAFVPLEGRPIDVMATNFVKALFSPNQYIYHRQGKRLSFSTISVAKPTAAKKSHDKTNNHIQTPTEQHDEKGEKLRALLLSTHDQAKSELDKKEAAFLNTLSLPSTQPPASSVTPPVVKKAAIPSQPVNVPQPAPVIPTVQPASQITPPPAPTIPPADNTKQEPVATAKPAPFNQTPLPTKPPVPPTAVHKANILSQQIDQIHAQKQQLEQELSHLKNQLASHKATPAPAPASIPTPTVQPAQPLQDPLHVRTIPQEVTKKVGLPHVSDSPNVVVGIVKDPRGNILANILVEVKDKDGNPVRAFKTNQLGQFASATPLSPGSYTIELDDPKKQHRFDAIQIVANNTVLLPIEIISHDAREELRKQLFAN